LHTVFYYLGLLTALGEVQDFSYPELSLNAQEQKAAAALLSAKAGPAGQPWVGLSPGAAYGPAKRWPAERFAALAEELSRQWGANLVLLGGPEDQAVAAEVQRHCRVPLANLTGRTSLRQALGVLRQLRLLITNDSGLMHAAAALMVPLVALFGSTDPAATGPFTEKATVLHHPLPCAPCLKRTCDLAYQCLTAISVAEVSAAARPWLEENP
jgi:heptosyltransferase-2